MRTRVLLSVLVVLSGFATGREALAQHTPENLLVGVWVLDVPASRYLPGPAVKAETRTYIKGPDGIKGVVERTHADGKVVTFEYIANTDREYMVTGTPDYDAVKLRQIDPFTSEALLTHAGAIYGTATRTIGRNGKTMRIIFRRADADVLNVAVYRKR